MPSKGGTGKISSRRTASQPRPIFDILMRMSAKNSVDSVRMAMITEMTVLLPSLPEQQRIATCLTSLDDLITASRPTRKG